MFVYFGFFSASSFYPGYHGLTSMSDLQTNIVVDPTADEAHSEDEDD